MKNLCFFLSLLFSLGAVAQHNHGADAGEPPAIHGMLIFGKDKIYASHLPMFGNTPHHYQLILELQLDKISQQKFINDQQQHPEFTTYTFSPEAFVLPDMLKTPKPFTASLFRGHFERGGTALSHNVTITIVKIIYLKSFTPSDKRSASADFFVFGNSTQQFMAHRISNKPDFDQVMEVKADAALLTSDTAHTVSITLNKSANEPLGVSGNDVSFLIHKKLVLLKQLYLEFDDLRE